MKNVDVELIQRVLDGDDTAFSDLVKKYYKSVHALAWRKTQDFHIAEDITQETFLKAYKGLSTLKEPQSFASWLYVIATNHSKTWLSKNRLQTQSLEDTDNTELEKATYSSYVSAENERASVEAQREVVKKLLAKLQESDRTVITLYYLGGMTYEEISRFLGVSVNAIKSRIYRARQYLKKEEPMIREALQNYQITPNLTENIMREIARLKPAAPTGGKPLVPWAVAASSAILIVLLLGLGSQHLLRFQQPYSLDAQAETTIELVDAPIVLNLEVKADVQNQLGLSNPLGKSDNNGQKLDEVLLASAQVDGEDVSIPKQQWIQSKAVSASPVLELCTTPVGNLYVLTKSLNFYRLSTNGNKWKQIFDVNNFKNKWGRIRSIAKWQNTLYFVTNNGLFTSGDDGESWDLLYDWKGEEHKYPIEFVVREQTFYLVFRNGIIRSIDTGKSWKNITNGLPKLDALAKRIRTLIEHQNTLFAGSYNGLYRYNGNIWKQVLFPVMLKEVFSTAATEGKLYVAARLGWEASQKLKRQWGIFRSTDLGHSWKDVTPTNAWNQNGNIPHIKLIAIDNTLLAMGEGMARSIDSGDTWLKPQAPGTTPSMGVDSPVAIVNDDVIYVGSWNGLYSSYNLGESWQMMNIWQKGGSIYDIIAMKKNDKDISDLVYARVIRSLTQGADVKITNDGGNSWNHVPIAMTMATPGPKLQPNITHIIKLGEILYAKAWDNITLETRIYSVSNDTKTLSPIQKIPVFSSKKLVFVQGTLTDHFTFLNDLFSNGHAFGATQFFKQLTQPQFGQRGDRDLIWPGLRGPFAVNNDTFYMEYNFKLFRWKQGDAEWYDTGMEETVELTEDIMRKNLKLAVSGDTVYVGKRDGHLVVSFDKGNNWIDLTQGLPFQVKTYKDIVVAGSTVCVATDAGIITSEDGKIWSTVTDENGTNLIVEHLAADGATLYGITKDTGIYRIQNATLKQIISDIPENVTSLAVDGNTLYVGTENRGMLHYNLEK